MAWGLPYVIKLCYNKSQYAAEKINDLSAYKLKFNKKFLKEFVIETMHNVKDLTDYCLQNGFLILNISDTLENCFQIAITEKRTKEEIDALIKCLRNFK